MRGAILALTILTISCVKSYSSAEPLKFSELPYAWEVKRIELPVAKEKFHLGSHHHVAVVELNPEGTQTVLFLHGLGSNLKFWSYQLEAFAKAGYRVVAFDQLGYGRSDKPAEFPYSMDAMSEVVDEVMGTLGIEKATLIGHSMGGEVAMVTAIRFPARVERLVLTSPAGFELISKREKAWFKQVFSASFVKSASEYAIWGSVRGANFARWRPELEWLIEERVRVAKSPEFDAYAYAQVRSVDGLAHNDFVRENLAKISAPTLIVYGEEDRLIPNPFLHGGSARSVMKWGASQIAGSKIEGLKRCGHTVQMDCPEEYNPIVLGFLGAGKAAE